MNIIQLQFKYLTEFSPWLNQIKNFWRFEFFFLSQLYQWAHTYEILHHIFHSSLSKLTYITQLIHLFQSFSFFRQSFQNLLSFQQINRSRKISHLNMIVLLRDRWLLFLSIIAVDWVRKYTHATFASSMWTDSLSRNRIDTKLNKFQYVIGVPYWPHRCSLTHTIFPFLEAVGWCCNIFQKQIFINGKRERTSAPQKAAGSWNRSVFDG